MRDERIANFYLDWRARQAMDKAEPDMVWRVRQSLERAGWQVTIRSDAERLQMARFAGHHLVVNRPVSHPRCVNLRGAYLPPFWRIESSNDRWNFTVAGQSFDPASIPQPEAQRFLDRWRVSQLKAVEPSRDGYIFMPLQGVLQRRRHFQSMSPIRMIDATLQADLSRPILATLHPNESYSDQDMVALQAIASRESRFVLSNAPSHDLLCGCDYVVTQNSSMVMTGYFAQKPAILFAEIDFHHIAQSVPRLGIERAFRKVLKKPPDFAAYLLWFMRYNAIAQFANDAEAKIATRLRQLGWPV